MRCKTWGVVAIGVSIGLMVPIAQLFTQQSNAQPSIKVRVNRWLEVRQLSGSVTYLKGGGSQSAHVGDRLQAVGDGVSTGAKSSTQLAVDTNVGFVSVAENTTLRIQSLQVAPDNGRVTRLHVSRGQARLRVRPFTHKGSQLEIITPSGISGVRGTDFGVTVQPNGKTGLATLKGGVLSSANNRSELVPAGFQNFTIPGEAPSPPTPLKNDTRLKVDVVRFTEAGVRKVKLIGKVDPVNAVLIGNQPISTDRQGRFSFLSLMPSFPRYQVTVITPLGKQQNHEVAL